MLPPFLARLALRHLPADATGVLVYPGKRFVSREELEWMIQPFLEPGVLRAYWLAALADG